MIRSPQDYMTDEEAYQYAEFLTKENQYLQDRIRFIKHWAKLGLDGETANETALSVIMGV